MRAHKITHNKEQAFKCTLCSTYVLHEDALERHYINVHTQDYICKICNKVYKSRKSLHNHESVSYK
jgi:Pyruvate/2-oxoacid:ferredoxin oxidoreductase delta subunit